MYNQPVVGGIRGRYGNNRWKAYSEKMQRSVNLYSDLEYYYWILIETDPQVSVYCEQPVRASIQTGGKTVDTIFDFWERRSSGEERFVEIKYSHEIDPNSARASNRSIQQTTAQKEWCELQGYEYAVVTEQCVYARPQYLKNKKRILSFVHEKITEHDVKRVLNVLEGKTLLVGDLVNHFTLETPSRALVTVAHLLFSGAAEADLDTVDYGFNTLIWLSK